VGDAGESKVIEVVEDVEVIQATSRRSP